MEATNAVSEGNWSQSQHNNRSLSLQPEPEPEPCVSQPPPVLRDISNNKPLLREHETAGPRLVPLGRDEDFSVAMHEEKQSDDNSATSQIFATSHHPKKITVALEGESTGHVELFRV